MIEMPTVYKNRLFYVGECEKEFDQLVENWMQRKIFDYFGSVLQGEVQSYLDLGAMAVRALKDVERAKQHWKSGFRVWDAYEKAIKLRLSLIEHKFEKENEGNFSIGDFWYMQLCLLMIGDRAKLKTLREYIDLPFMVFPKPPLAPFDVYSAEVKILWAAWEGKEEEVNRLSLPLSKHYKTYKLSLAYGEVWKTIARRDSQALSALLPELEDAYRKSARRRSEDVWGGEKAYNIARFDYYTTSALKIAHDLGMTWGEVSPYGQEIWPREVIELWT